MGAFLLLFFSLALFCIKLIFYPQRNSSEQRDWSSKKKKKRMKGEGGVITSSNSSSSNSNSSNNTTNVNIFLLLQGSDYHPLSTFFCIVLSIPFFLRGRSEYVERAIAYNRHIVFFMLSYQQCNNNKYNIYAWSERLLFTLSFLYNCVKS
ncbi:hypothetical protein BDB00DRAFT_72356 [Zychaea mexicana]|uniref:uncharacterized protein n=1 Tax=Zychaea mexicana TaxID=64656 RepID=UPI0022FE4406|nr:uncharacterized protein BDB00DRAFT_72356 [Zychaea mexicana]KAI9496770.1 hypothetical protein BDB00DRAFT_72356 [Zychaea mexicana]